MQHNVALQWWIDLQCVCVCVCVLASGKSDFLWSVFMMLVMAVNFMTPQRTNTPSYHSLTLCHRPPPTHTHTYTHTHTHTQSPSSLSGALTCPVVCVSREKQDITLNYLWGHQLREMTIDLKEETLSCRRFLADLKQNTWITKVK